MQSRRRRIVRALLAAYKATLSPLFGGSCRFTPSCSEYMAEAIEVHGWIRGGGLGIRRLTRCMPLGGWGPDPVPLPRAEQACRAIARDRSVRAEAGES